GFGIFTPGPGSEAARDMEDVRGAGVERRPVADDPGQHRRRHEYVDGIARLEPAEPSLGDTDDGEGTRAHEDVVADDVGPHAELLDPESVAQHCHWMTAAHAVVGRRQQS